MFEPGIISVKEADGRPMSVSSFAGDGHYIKDTYYPVQSYFYLGNRLYLKWSLALICL